MVLVGFFDAMIDWLSEKWLRPKMASAVLDMKKASHPSSNVSPAGLSSVIIIGLMLWIGPGPAGSCQGCCKLLGSAFVQACPLERQPHQAMGLFSHSVG